MKKRRPKDAKRTWAIANVKDTDMCPYMQRVLQKPTVTAVHAPNPNVRRFHECANDAAINKELSEMTKKLSGTSEYTKLYYENMVLGQVSDPKTGYAIFGVTTAPTPDLITNVSFFHPIPEHLLGKFMPKEVIKPNECAKYLHRDATHQDAIIGGVQLTYETESEGEEDVTFDWIRYDPRFPVIRKWINANYPSTTTADEEQEAEDDEEEEEVKEPVPPPPPAPMKKKQQQQQPGKNKKKVKAEKEEEEEEADNNNNAKGESRKKAAQRLLEAGVSSVIQSCTIQHTIEERRNPGFFPAGFRINVSALHANLKRVSKVDSLEFIKCLVVSEQPYDFLGHGFQRWHQQSAGAALTTGNIDNTVALIRGDKSHIQRDVMQLGVEWLYTVSVLDDIVQQFPELLKTGRAITGMAACSEKLVALRTEAVKAPSPPARCALTGQLIASSAPCYALDFCDPNDPADIVTLYVKKEFDVAQIRAAATPPTVVTELTPHGEVSFPLLPPPSPQTTVVKKVKKAPVRVVQQADDDPMEGVTETSPPPPKKKPVPPPQVVEKKKKPIQEEEAKKPVKEDEKPQVEKKEKKKKPVQKEERKEEVKKPTEHAKKKTATTTAIPKTPKKVVKAALPKKKKEEEEAQKENNAKEEEEAVDKVVVEEPKPKKKKVSAPEPVVEKKKEETLDKSQTNPFWGYLPKEWNQPTSTVLNGTPLFLSLCREAFSKPPDPILDTAIARLLSVECDTNVLRAAIVDYTNSGTMGNYPAWTACCFAIASQFLLSTLDDEALLLDPGHHVTLALATGCEPNHYRALPLFLAGGDRLKANASNLAESPFLKYIVSAAKPFTAVQLATARVLFQKLVAL